LRHADFPAIMRVFALCTPIVFAPLISRFFSACKVCITPIPGNRGGARAERPPDRADDRRPRGPTPPGRLALPGRGVGRGPLARRGAGAVGRGTPPGPGESHLGRHRGDMSGIVRGAGEAPGGRPGTADPRPKMRGTTGTLDDDRGGARRGIHGARFGAKTVHRECPRPPAAGGAWHPAWSPPRASPFTVNGGAPPSGPRRTGPGPVSRGRGHHAP